MPKILIVEDEPLLARMYQTIFELKQYQVVLAQNGEEAITQAQATKPDFILLDVMMPKMDGLQALEKLKADDQTKAIPVAMLTNLAVQSEANRALSHGALQYLIKSEHDPVEIVDIVNRLLDPAAPAAA